MQNELARVASDELWVAVQKKDRRYDGKFVFAVASTGIFCVPSCPSRRARKENVVFFSRPEEAEAAGFGACLRCKPKDEGARSRQKRTIDEVCSFIDKNPDRKVTLAVLSDRLGISPFHLQRTFKRAVGITPRQYAEKSKLDTAKLLLKRGESVRKSTYGAGHNSVSWLYSNGEGILGMDPSSYKEGGAGMRISYHITGCRLGRLLVAGTDHGVCAVSLGDSDETLRLRLRNEYPNAEIGGDDDKPTGWVDRILTYIEATRPHHLHDLPLDIRATSFQYRVWRELRSIPCGWTKSYTEIARRVGSPKATRAVANACAANPVAIVIPCHRAVRKSGELGGYRRGPERKRALLEKEAEAIKDASMP
jgi:AraC family transcriptional regulator of adaptative response/methylated-DNA-[protein]-cysteine methyltransferase